ncbi:MAG: biotin--[acetyl-CoA-carboxylase] ligase [Gracilimonas sp.]|nr:biotin--[acetyl-CoA-carboxylase] ligase [Gracilimonas sp.]
MFDTTILEKKLATSWLGRSFSFFEELPSTNSYAKKIKSRDSLHGTLILTDYQNAGRGQHDRNWSVYPGQNLTFSLIFEPQKAERLNLLTLVCALSVKEVIESKTSRSVSLKWPNDVLIDDKKVCGILTETVFIGNKLNRVVVGIGLNVHQQEFPGELSETATSLQNEIKESLKREKLLTEILQKIEYRYRLWVQQDQNVVKLVNRSMLNTGEWCRLQVNDQILQEEFKFLGVNEDGEFIAMDKEFSIRKFTHEQVRVKGKNRSKKKPV